MSIAAGWYSDPSDSRAVRWWTGSSWTEHVAATASHAPAFAIAPEFRSAASDRRPFGEMIAGTPSTEGRFDDLLLGGERAVTAEATVDPDAEDRRRRIVAIVIVSVALVALVVTLGAFGISFLHGLSEGLRPN